MLQFSIATLSCKISVAAHTHQQLTNISQLFLSINSIYLNSSENVLHLNILNFNSYHVTLSKKISLILFALTERLIKKYLNSIYFTLKVNRSSLFSGLPS